MNRLLARTAPRALAAALLLGGALAALPAEAQYRPPARGSATALRTPATPGLTRGSYVVVVDLDANRLHFTRDRRVLWSAPIGSGTGLRLEHEKGEWDFSTPNGVFHVQHKAENPVWLAPDWYFIENDLPVPPRDSPKRRFPGGLGAAAVYIGHGLAIHGTDKPELLGQRVSHGCIRLSNRDALRLFHNVQVGTEVVIVGGKRSAPATAPPAKPASARTRGGETMSALQQDPFLELLKSLSTEELLLALDEELRAGGESRWPEVAGVLLRRSWEWEDGEALEGVLARTGRPRGKAAQEYATFLADAYARRPGSTLRALGNLDDPERSRAAAAIVEASVALYPGDPADRAAPWPTRRVPRDGLRGRMTDGWDALARAERAHGERDERVRASR